MAIAVAIGGIAAVVAGDDLESKPPSIAAGPTLDYTVDIPKAIDEAGVPASEAGCSDIETPPDQGSHQVDLGEGHPAYSSTPPTSGWYTLAGLTPALYYSPISEPEALVRNMAEGGVVIWHSGLTEQELGDLKGAMVLLESDQLVGLPGDDFGLDQKIVLTAWGHLQRCDEVSGEAIAVFFEQFVGKGPLA
ncbi:MAG: DUF3105 domain-containing protein [Actinomycetota bacterium]